MFLFGAADDAVQCIVQFAAVAIVLLFSFGGWVIKQIAQANNNQNQKLGRQSPQRPGGAAPRPPAGGRQNSAGGQATAQQGGRAPGVQILHSSPYDTAEENPYVLEADIIEATAVSDVTSLHPKLEHHLTPSDTEEDVHQRFDYEVGSLGDSSDAIHENPLDDQLPKEAVTVDEIAGVFRHPERIREAIILNEILTRPDY